MGTSLIVTRAVLPAVVVAISSLWVVSAAAERWAFLLAEDGPKLGFVVPESNHLG
jgi:hypothetical protein